MTMTGTSMVLIGHTHFSGPMFYIIAFPFPLTLVHTSPPSLIHHTSSYTLRSSDALLIPVQTPLANSALLNKCVQNVGSFHIPPTYMHSMFIHALV